MQCTIGDWDKHQIKPVVSVLEMLKANKGKTHSKDSPFGANSNSVGGINYSK